jgi:hypothetical protein
LFELVAFVDAEMDGPLRISLQYGAVLFHGIPGIHRKPTLCPMPGRLDARRISVTVDKEIGDGKILAVELAGKKEKVACEEQAF